jgi:hypothetical protein
VVKDRSLLEKNRLLSFESDIFFYAMEQENENENVFRFLLSGLNFVAIDRGLFLDAKVLFHEGPGDQM